MAGTVDPTSEASAEAEKPAAAPFEGYTQDEVARLAGTSASSVGRAVARGIVEPMANGRLDAGAVEKLREMRQADVAARDATHDLERRLLAAQAAEREAKAELRKLELAREAGRFVQLDVVQRDAADMRERILAVLRSIPQRTAMALECSCRGAAVVEKKIAAEVERAIGELGESIFAGNREEKKK